METLKIQLGRVLTLPEGKRNSSFIGLCAARNDCKPNKSPGVGRRKKVEGQAPCVQAPAQFCFVSLFEQPVRQIQMGAAGGRQALWQRFALVCSKHNFKLHHRQLQFDWWIANADVTTGIHANEKSSCTSLDGSWQRGWILKRKKAHQNDEWGLQLGCTTKDAAGHEHLYLQGQPVQQGETFFMMSTWTRRGSTDTNESFVEHH